MGQGGEGEGTGDGIGDGDGPGRGGTPPLILKGASTAEILSIVPPEARRARQAGRASINCVIRTDERLDDCRVVSETPVGFRFGDPGRSGPGAGLPRQCGAGSAADLRGRYARPPVVDDRPGRPAGHLHGAAQLHPPARRRLSPTRLRPAHRRLLHRGDRFFRPAGSGHGPPLGQPLPAGEDRPDRRPVDRGQADRLLCGPGRARADPLGPRGGRPVVGRRLRQGRLHRRLPGGGPARCTRDGAAGAPPPATGAGSAGGGGGGGSGTGGGGSRVTKTGGMAGICTGAGFTRPSMANRAA